MLKFTPPGRDRFIASTAGVRATIASISVTVGATCAATVVHDASASASVSVSAQAKGHFTYFAIADVTISATAAGQRTATGTANIGVDITASADATTFTAHSGTADVSVAIGASASATTITPIEGAATCSIVITASADGETGTLHSSSTADCQVNISASARGFNPNTAVPDETSNGNTLYIYNHTNTPVSSFVTDAAIGTRSTEFLGSNTLSGTGYYGIIDDTFESTFQSSFSISVWVKFNSQTPTNNWILGNTKLGGDGGDNDNVALWFQEGTPRFWYRAGGVSKFTDASSYTANTDWTHVVATYDSSSDTTTLYLDGSSEATNTTSIDPTEYTNSVKMRVSKFEDASSNVIYTRKKIDDISIWSKTLSATEVSNLYNSGSGTDLSGSSDLVGWWKMGDHSVVTTTHSGTATVSVAVTASASGSVSTFNNYSISLDGSNDYLSVSDHNDFSFGNSTSDSAFSVSAWIKMDDATKFRIFSKQTNSANIEYVFGVDGLDRLGVNLYDGATSNFRGVYSSSINSYQGSWIHVVMTYDGSGGASAYNGMELYLNGSVLSTSNNQGGGYTAMHNTSTDVWIGGANFVPDYADGKMDEVAVFSAELTSTQVSNIYNNGTPTDLSSESNLVGYWRMEENTGTTVADSSGNGHTATLNNGPTFSTDVP